MSITFRGKKKFFSTSDRSVGERECVKARNVFFHLPTASTINLWGKFVIVRFTRAILMPLLQDRERRLLRDSLDPAPYYHPSTHPNEGKGGSVGFARRLMCLAPTWHVPSSSSICLLLRAIRVEGGMTKREKRYGMQAFIHKFPSTLNTKKILAKI